MRKNHNYSITSVSTRNELADALDNKEMVVELKDEVYSTMAKEMKESAHSNRKNRINAEGYAVGAVLSAFIAWPLMLIQGIVAGFNALDLATSDIKKYMIAIVPDEDGDRLLLINRKFQPSLDQIETLEQYRFTENGECPYCSAKIKSMKKLVKKEQTLYTCPKCSKETIICI